MDIFLYTLCADWRLAPPSVVKYSTERFIIQYIIGRRRECEEAWLEEISHWGRCCLVLCSSSSIVSLTLVLRNVKSFALSCTALSDFQSCIRSATTQHLGYAQPCDTRRSLGCTQCCSSWEHVFLLRIGKNKNNA